jgi:hypothetical protein
LGLKKGKVGIAFVSHFFLKRFPVNAAVLVEVAVFRNDDGTSQISRNLIQRLPDLPQSE